MCLRISLHAYNFFLTNGTVNGVGENSKEGSTGRNAPALGDIEQLALALDAFQRPCRRPLCRLIPG